MQNSAGRPTPGVLPVSREAQSPCDEPVRARGPRRSVRPVPDPATIPQPGDILEARYRYQIERRLGQGGFGSVYRARCLNRGSSAPPETVAIKVLGSSSDPRTASSLKRELSALLTIDDDRIPNVYDWSLEGDNAFVAMEHFAAGSLSDAWPFLGHRNEQQVWRLITDLLSALSAAHRAGILHLDLKPSNVLLDGNGGFVLSDFGVSQAARMSKGLLHQGKVAVGLGTHGYRAPEQDRFSLKDFDLRTDLWAVGATAWALYTGIDLNKRQEVLRRAEEKGFRWRRIWRRSRHPSPSSFTYWQRRGDVARALPGGVDPGQPGPPAGGRGRRRRARRRRREQRQRPRRVGRSPATRRARAVTKRPRS